MTDTTARVPLTPKSSRALRRLAKHSSPPDPYPMRRRAAILIALFGDRSGHLRVILSTRSSMLRSHPGEVCLPGGKMDDTDPDLIHTARREAFEEIGLPISSPNIQHLTTLPPFLTRSHLIVTPVVVMIREPNIQPKLNLDEVENIFSHPLEAFLFNSPKEPVLHSLPPDVQSGKLPYHKMWDVPWYGNSPIRYHSFVNPKGEIRGFTSNVLIEAAQLAYNSPPEFDRRAKGQIHRKQLFRIALRKAPDFNTNNNNTVIPSKL